WGSPFKCCRASARRVSCSRSRRRTRKRLPCATANSPKTRIEAVPSGTGGAVVGALVLDDDAGTQGALATLLGRRAVNDACDRLGGLAVPCGDVGAAVV